MFYRTMAVALCLSVPVCAAPVASTAARASANFLSVAPNSNATAHALVEAATAARLTKSSGEKAANARKHLMEALAQLGHPEMALRYADESETDEIWRTTAQVQAQSGDLERANRALTKIEDDESRLNSLWAITRAQLRKGDLADARNTLLRAQKLLPSLRQSLSGREIYAYNADLWRRAGDDSAALRVLRAMPADTFADMDADRDSLKAAEFFALRAGGDAGLKLQKAPHRLILDAVRVWSQGGHFARAVATAQARPNVWERTLLLGEIAFYERAFSSQTSAAALFEAETQRALAQLDQVSKSADWGEDWPYYIALDLAQLGKNEAAENFAAQTQARREKIAHPANSWVEGLRDAGLSPTIWPRLDAARREKLRANVMKNAEDFRTFYQLFSALQFDGDTTGARRVLELGLTKMEQPEGELDQWSAIWPATQFWFAASAARKLGWNERAETLAAQAAEISTRGGKKPWEVADELFENGFATQGAALAFRNPPPPDEFTGFYWFAYHDATARDLKTVPPWIATMRAGLNKVEALAGFVAGQERNRSVTLLNDEDEFSLGESDGNSLFIDPDLLNLRWQDVARFPRLAH